MNETLNTVPLAVQSTEITPRKQSTETCGGARRTGLFFFTSLLAFVLQTTENTAQSSKHETPKTHTQTTRVICCVAGNLLVNRINPTELNNKKHARTFTGQGERRISLYFQIQHTRDFPVRGCHAADPCFSDRDDGTPPHACATNSLHGVATFATASSRPTSAPSAKHTTSLERKLRPSSELALDLSALNPLPPPTPQRSNSFKVSQVLP